MNLNNLCVAGFIFYCQSIEQNYWTSAPGDKDQFMLILLS